MQTKYHWQLKTHISTFVVILYKGNRFTQMQEQYKKAINLAAWNKTIFRFHYVSSARQCLCLPVREQRRRQTQLRMYILRMPTDNKVVNAMVLASRWYVHKNTFGNTAFSTAMFRIHLSALHIWRHYQLWHHEQHSYWMYRNIKIEL